MLKWMSVVTRRDKIRNQCIIDVSPIEYKIVSFKEKKEKGSKIK